VQGDEPEVVYGRHLLAGSVEVPLPRVLVMTHRAMEEAEAAFRREWEKLEAERQRLSDWDRHLKNHIQQASSRAADEQAKFEKEREAHHVKVSRIFDREVTVVLREKAVAQKEKEVDQKERSARDTMNTAKAMAKLIDDEQATLNHREQDLSRREVTVTEEETRLSALRTDLTRREEIITGEGTRLAALRIVLEAQCQRQEEESRSLLHRLQVLKNHEAEVEGLLAEQRAGVQRIANWVGEASTAQEPLGLSPIQVAEAPASIIAVLLALDSTAECLQCLESTLVAHCKKQTSFSEYNV